MTIMHCFYKRRLYNVNLYYLSISISRGQQRRRCKLQRSIQRDPQLDVHNGGQNSLGVSSIQHLSAVS